MFSIVGSLAHNFIQKLGCHKKAIKNIPKEKTKFKLKMTINKKK